MLITHNRLPQVNFIYVLQYIYLVGGSNPSDGIIFPNILKKKFQTTNQIDIYIYILNLTKKSKNQVTLPPKGFTNLRIQLSRK